VPISELVFGTLTQNRSSLEPSLEFAAIAGTPRIENGGTVAVDFADRRRDRKTCAPMFWGPVADERRDRHNVDVQPDAPQPFGVPPFALMCRSHRACRARGRARALCRFRSWCLGL
jgi:hypothetical protein